MEQLRKRDGNKCSVCGDDDARLEVEHIAPISRGGNDSLDNLRLVCSKHHRVRGELHEFEFVDYLFQLLRLSENFRNVEMGTPIGKRPRFQADLTAEEYVDGQWQQLVIECKAYTTFTRVRLDDTYAWLQNIRKHIGDTRMALAFPGELSRDSLQAATKLGIQIWDLSYLAERFQWEIPEVAHPVLQSMLMAKKPPVRQTLEELLIDDLESCKPGRSNWAQYEKLIGSILERLFCPPLTIPISQLSDILAVNRRDFILPNYAEEGFWAVLRSRYSADYIVVDAKNYSGKVKKLDVLKISNYLKEHGAGLFGLIICRNGGDRGCEYTLREVWAIDKKLILVLTDYDIKQMLLAKSSASPPHSIIRQKIEDFRLSL